MFLFNLRLNDGAEWNKRLGGISTLNWQSHGRKKKTNNGDCTIIRYPRVGVKYTWQVNVSSELKLKLFCFFTLRTMVWIFIDLVKRYLSFSSIKIRNNSEQTKTSRKKVMQLTSSNKRFATNCSLPCLQTHRFWQAHY